MAAGDIKIYQFQANDAVGIAAGLAGKIVVADDFTAHVWNGIVTYTVVKAA